MSGKKKHMAASGEEPVALSPCTASPAGMPVILALHEVDDRTWARQFAGIRRYAAERGWRAVGVRCAKGDLDGAARAVCKFSPAGVISSLSVPLEGRTFERLKAVYFDCSASAVPEGAPYMGNDAAAIAHFASRELFSLKCKAYSFAAVLPPQCVETPEWMQEREAHFRSECARRGGGCLEPFGPGSGAELSAWLRELEKPCGIFAANDFAAAAVRDAALKLGLRIPGEVAIVGVDDDRRICLGKKPGITSVAPDWERGGFSAAAALDEILAGRRLSGRMTFYPLGLMRRETTARLARADARIVAAIALIRAKACKGLGAAHVAQSIHGSRRFAEKLFRDVTGESILEEIRRVRFDAAKVLLAHSALSLEHIAAKTGYASAPTFCREFKSMTGMAPRFWRKRFLQLRAQSDNNTML